MISRLTKIQLVLFAIVTVVGGAFVGGRYAQLDRLFVDRTFPVVMELRDSGGIFQGAQVTYRGIEVGTVGSLTFTDAGVEARLDIENDAPEISSDVLAVVANKSAIGEQFVDLQPRTAEGPYLKAGSRISTSNTRIPLDTAQLLIDLNDLVKSVPTEDLRTVVAELGTAFDGTGDDLSRILDTSNSFILTAQENIPVTRQLIQDSATVLQTQIDSESAISTFSQNLALFSDALVDADPDLRRLLDDGTGAARTLRGTIAENEDDLSVTVNNLLTATQPLKKNVLGLRSVFTLYPYLIQGSYSVVQPSIVKGEYDATFGLVLEGPEVCSYDHDGEASGYRSRRTAANVTDNFLDGGQQFTFPSPVDVDCKVEDNAIVRQASKASFNRDAPVSPGADEGNSFRWLMLDPVTR